MTDAVKKNTLRNRLWYWEAVLGERRAYPWLCVAIWPTGTAHYDQLMLPGMKQRAFG